MQDSVLTRIDSRDLVAYAVWEPILKTDDERSARKATILFPDDRVKHYWVDTRDVGKLFQTPIGLQNEVAWDVYLVYGPGGNWDATAPPAPDYFMHQLAGRLPDSQMLDGGKLASEIREVLSR